MEGTFLLENINFNNEVFLYWQKYSVIAVKIKYINLFLSKRLFLF